MSATGGNPTQAHGSTGLCVKKLAARKAGSQTGAGRWWRGAVSWYL